jgi:hypothetical protein
VGPVTWHITSDVSVFAENAGRFLRSSPVRHTTLLTVVGTLRSRVLHAYGQDDPIFGWWTSDSGEVAGALVQTPPYPLTLTEVPPEAVPEPVTALGKHPLGAANLLAGDVPAFTEAWTGQRRDPKCVGRRRDGRGPLHRPDEQRPVPRLGYRPIEDRAVVEFSR